MARDTPHRRQPHVVRILIADDHEVVRYALRKVIERAYPTLKF